MGRSLLAVVVAAASLLMLAGVAWGGLLGGTSGDGRKGQFNAPCSYSHRLPDDPIVAPGAPGGSHSHDFLGNSSTNAHSTLDSLAAAPALCRREGDRSAWWAPTLYRSGRAIPPKRANIYYRTAGRDPATISTFPRGLRVVAGKAKAKGPQDPRLVRWDCADSPKFSEAPEPSSVPGRAGRLRRAIRRHRRAIRRHRRALRRARRAAHRPRIRRHRRAIRRHRRAIRRHRRELKRLRAAEDAAVPLCPSGSRLRLAIRFPDCWDGRNLDSPDHQSHLAYAHRSRAERRMACPPSHSVAVPKVSLNLVYDTGGGSGVTLASGPAYTAHADFFNAWDSEALAALVRRCLNADVHCGKN